MNLGEIIVEAIKSGTASSYTDDLARCDFHLAEHLPFKLFKKLDDESKKMQLLFKSYLLATVRGDK